MSDDLEAIGTMAEAAMVGSAVEKATGKNLEGAPEGNCLNCGALRDGTYCSHCGQSAHIHRSISAFWHDILHGVLHFDGKFWRTIPLLAWRPGELTRRYVHGERAKFISPMALFLFAIFMMFAIFSFLPSGGTGPVVPETTAESADTSDAQDTDGIDIQIADSEAGSEGISEEDIKEMASGSDWVGSAIKKATENPEFLLYKLKSNGYKFAWLLIPLSIPFIWLATIGVRGHRFYDHAVFCTYSLAFMSLLFIVSVLLSAIGVPTALIVIAGILYPLIHVYKQLRHAYQLSRIGTVIRMMFLLFFMIIVAFLFSLILLALGMMT